MKSIMEFFVNKLEITDDGTIVNVDTQVLTKFEGEKLVDGFKLPRSYCNFVITYDEYIRMRLKVGDSIKIIVSKIRG